MTVSMPLIFLLMFFLCLPLLLGAVWLGVLGIFGGGVLPLFLSPDGQRAVLTDPRSFVGVNFKSNRPAIQSNSDHQLVGVPSDGRVISTIGKGDPPTLGVWDEDT